MNFLGPYSYYEGNEKWSPFHNTPLTVFFLLQHICNLFSSHSHYHAAKINRISTMTPKFLVNSNSARCLYSSQQLFISAHVMWVECTEITNSPNKIALLKGALSLKCAKDKYHWIEVLYSGGRVKLAVLETCPIQLVTVWSCVFYLNLVRLTFFILKWRLC